MSLKVDLESPELAAIRAELDGMRERVGDLTPAMEAGAEAVRTAIMDRFDLEQDFYGRDWAEHSPEWEKRRKPAKKNVQDGTMRTDVHAEGDRDSIRFGVSGASEKYAGKNQRLRPFLPVDEDGDFIDALGTPGGDLMDEIEATIAAHIEGGREE